MSDKAGQSPRAVQSEGGEKLLAKASECGADGSQQDEGKSVLQIQNEHKAEDSGAKLDSEPEASQTFDQIGACGGCSTVLKEGMELCSVVPLPWCPHLKEVTPVPVEFINTDAPCLKCGNIGENWVCLTCYEVYCSRYVNEDMLMHGLATEHKMVLSLLDFSVWCYGCEAYVHNEVLQEAKRAAHQYKFKESIPGPS